ncbi:MAG: hypothetical protein EHM59_05105 [Betaproteobacteria bacterium]|nr:MAG: hypothetical protein EHM59_05105 [Betaproteobacteria bacterium]
MSEQQPMSPRQRLQALLAIPERQRTDAQWDELIELEIMFAPGNREGAPQPGRRNPNVAPGGHNKPGGGGSHGKKSGKKFHKRPPKPNAP